MADDDIILGIDLGTTFSAMACVDRHGKPVILPNADGHPTTPSILHFYEKDACVVGEEALKMVVADASNIARFIKRHMGDPDFSLEFHGVRYSPQELSALILRKLKEDAEEQLGRAVKDSVITVPAYFNSAQRGATIEAGRLAGLEVLSLLNEPTAAAIAYGVERMGVDRDLLVFDLGGGTFDVTIMEIRGPQLRTIATDGNAELGGKDWDDRLVDHVADVFYRTHRADPRDDSQAYQELYERAVGAKIALSTKPRAVIPVNYAGQRLAVQVTREEFEELTKDLVQQCADTCGLVLEKGGRTWDDIDEILLAGGSTRMPMVQSMLTRISGKAPSPGVNPDECVAVGAALAGVFRHRPNHPAIHLWRSVSKNRRDGTSSARSTTSGASRPVPVRPAGLPTSIATPPPPAPRRGASIALAEGGSLALAEVEQIEGALPDVRFTDVASHPLGIVVLDRNLQERVVPLIPQYTPLPCERRGRFAYAYDGMTAVRVEITEGHGSSRDEVQVIGEVILDELPPRPKGTPIEVTYRYTANQILEVDVTDLETAQSRRAVLHLRGSLEGDALAEAARRVRAASVRPAAS